MNGYIDRNVGSMVECMDRWLDGWIVVGMNG
jgi:hypothetical protein